jgi:hypothetical protein
VCSRVRTTLSSARHQPQGAHGWKLSSASFFLECSESFPTFKSNDAHGILLLYDDGLHQSSYPFNLLCTPHFIIEFLYFTWSRTYDAQRKRKKYTPRGMPNVKYSSSTLPCGEKKAKGAKNRIIPRAFLSWAVLLVCVRTYVVPTWVHDRLTMRSSAGFKNQHRLENRFESV